MIIKFSYNSLSGSFKYEQHTFLSRKNEKIKEYYDLLATIGPSKHNFIYFTLSCFLIPAKK